MTYAINLKKAQHLMISMEMYARMHRFTAEHSEFMAKPDSSSLRVIRNAVSCNNTLAKEDTHVLWVYDYYSVLAADLDYDGDMRLHDLTCALRDFNSYRFPAPRSAADLAYDHTKRMERLNSPRYIAASYAGVLANRPWHSREQCMGDIHDAVFKAWHIAKPENIDQLMMEWPRNSKQGHHMIAYTRDENYGEADRQTAVSVGKYLTRHFPTLASNTIRDIAALYCEAKIEITHDMGKMIEIIENGPGSCMSGAVNRFDSCGDHHPYEAYTPQRGWHMAYITEGTRITGRALLNEKTFVRTYRGNDSTGYSSTDDRLNAWLQEQGYSKARDWRGFTLAKIAVRNDCGFLAPFLDGDSKDVDAHRDHLEIVRSGEGEYLCNGTQGDAESQSANTCEDCDSRISDDDSYHVYRHADRCVCESCYENNYTFVIGRNQEQYSVDNDNAIEVGGTSYDSEWLSDNGIVQLHDGDYAKDDEAVYLNGCGEYYLADSDDICYTVAGEYELVCDCVELADGNWCLRDDAWQCEHSGDWYENDVDSVTTKGGKRIHEDYADEYELENADAVGSV